MSLVYTYILFNLRYLSMQVALTAVFIKMFIITIVRSANAWDTEKERDHYLCGKTLEWENMHFCLKNVAQ